MMDGSTSQGLMVFYFFRLEPAFFLGFWPIVVISFNIGLACQKELSACGLSEERFHDIKA
jgi:hypothetical protein